jgi:peptidoglycan/xylan/chitin deacetylase (PgdA/CDA1 family)
MGLRSLQPLRTIVDARIKGQKLRIFIQAVIGDIYGHAGHCFAFEELGDDIGVHTSRHQFMTTPTNEQVVAELGWTLQIIHDSTCGRVPRCCCWRPPDNGDVDNRVRAIVPKVFGLTSVV